MAKTKQTRKEALIEPPYKMKIKAKGFCPNPVAVWGIPEYADSSTNPDVIGTSEHEAWWEEQFEYCMNGFHTGGMYIPPAFYYYLNFTYISTVGRGNHFPDYVDCDQEYFDLQHWCKANRKGIITIKARRRGLSEKMKTIINHGLRFGGKGYKAGICAGMQTYADQLFSKVKYHNSIVAPELFVNTTSNDERYVLTYESSTKRGTWKKDGSLNEVMCKTMGKDANVMKGNLFYDLAFEEAGEFDLLEEGFNASKDCFMLGDQMVGTPYIFGTGGDINSSSKGFQKMWEEAEKYDLERFRVHAQRIYNRCFIGSKNEKGEINHECPNIVNNKELIESVKRQQNNEDVTFEQFLGCEDTADALKKIAVRTAELRKAKDKKKLYDFMQNNPTNDRECFLKFSGNNFDPIALNDNRNEIIMNDYKFRGYIIPFKKDSLGRNVMPLQIDYDKIRVADTMNQKEMDECVYIHKFPIKGFRNHQVAGIDSYDIDQTHTSKSLGAMVVLARDAGMTIENQLRPLCLVRQRPYRKEIFYENCLKVSMLYDLVCDGSGGNVLIDHAKPMIIDYFKANNGTRFLSPRPKSIESANSEQTNEFGVNWTIHSKPIGISRVQSWVLDHVYKNVFPQLNAELQDYDVNVKDSDWDCVDALMNALTRHYDMLYLPERTSGKEEIDIYPVENYPNRSTTTFNEVLLKVANTRVVTANGTVVEDFMTKYMNMYSDEE